MTNPQGTTWESEIVGGARDSGSPYHNTGRYPKRAQKGEPDLWIGQAEPTDAIPLVIWKRLVGKKSDGRRKPDGVRAVVVLDWEDFKTMLPFLPFNFEVQAKWTNRLNVTRVLGELKDWLKENR